MVFGVSTNSDHSGSTRIDIDCYITVKLSAVAQSDPDADSACSKSREASRTRALMEALWPNTIVEDAEPYGRDLATAQSARSTLRHRRVYPNHPARRLPLCSRRARGDGGTDAAGE